MQVWLNGSFVDRDEARIGVFDAGFQHAVGLFETMHVRNGRVFRLEAHIERLRTSAGALDLTERLRAAPLADAVRATVERNGLDRARVRLTVTGGDLNLLQTHGEQPTDLSTLIVAQPPTEYPPRFFESGVVVAIADGRENPLDPMAGHKTLNYWPRIRALQQVGAAGASEALWFTVSNHLASGSVSNVFLVQDDTLRTPAARGEEAQGALPSTVLPGITRAAVMELAETAGLDVETGVFDIEDLLGAQEVFLTNSSWGVLPVVAVERSQIGAGAVGPVTKRLRAGWMDLVEHETSA